MSELSELKNEVASLWSRFRREEPQPNDDELRRGLVEQLRAREGARRALAERAENLRRELEQHRRRASRLAPLVRFAGGVVGAGLCGLLFVLLPAEAVPVLPQGAAVGGALFVGALLLVAVALARARR